MQKKGNIYKYFAHNNNGDFMYKKQNYFSIFKILFPLVCFMIVSIISIYSSQFLLSASYNTLYIKQILWYVIGFIFILLIYKINRQFIYKYIDIIYIFFNILLLLVLFFGSSTNGSRCWFSVPFIGSFQPSEFMKVVLIIMLSKTLSKYEKMKKTFKNELILITKCIIITLIPCILIFLEPDTGLILIYLSILMIMLFIYGIRYRWFISFIVIIGIMATIFFTLFFKYQDTFIKIFSTSFFYRIDRLIGFKNKDSMQLTNALASLGSAGLFGYGFKNTPIYFPEPHTDFIFAVFSSNFGFIYSIILILLIIYFDLQLIIISSKCNFNDKLIITGILSMLLFQQIQNISMNIGLLPITGITLPFISYGGSSLISYMITIGIILNIQRKKTI